VGEFEELLKGAGLSKPQIDAASAFRAAVLDENERQNLTRLLNPQDFFRGHVLDVLELRRFRAQIGDLGNSALDLGTGAGVPGLLSAAIFPDERWILVDSEVRKAEYLTRAVDQLGLSARVQVIHGRMEQVSDEIPQVTIVSRAVGTVEKLMAWLDSCSTWNTMILLKGPRWNPEWAEFQQSRWRKTLQLGNRHEYFVGDQITRVAIQLKRVPRGTSKN
jgi:16S rRNA (guanine(527)-N(7))-methyltransferase RsmG